MDMAFWHMSALAHRRDACQHPRDPGFAESGPGAGVTRSAVSDVRKQLFATETDWNPDAPEYGNIIPPLFPSPLVAREHAIEVFEEPFQLFAGPLRVLPHVAHSVDLSQDIVVQFILCLNVFRNRHQRHIA